MNDMVVRDRWAGWDRSRPVANQIGHSHTALGVTRPPGSSGFADLVSSLRERDTWLYPLHGIYFTLGSHSMWLCLAQPGFPIWRYPIGWKDDP